MKPLLILILVMLWLITCAVCTFVGFFVGRISIKRKPATKPAPPSLRQKIAQKEFENFMNYDGTPQEPIQ